MKRCRVCRSRKVLQDPINKDEWFCEACRCEMMDDGQVLLMPGETHAKYLAQGLVWSNVVRKFVPIIKVGA